MTKLMGVIGDPIAHSLSPVIHRSWLRSAGINASYEALKVSRREFPSAIKTLTERDSLGFNVTMPHKAAALEASFEASVTAARLGAANTLSRLPETRWRADNTDVPGFLWALEQEGLGDLSGKHVLVLGAGGAARAVCYALHCAGANLKICNRTVAKAEELCKDVLHTELPVFSLDQCAVQMSETDLVINTLGLGFSGDPLELPAGKGRLFFDISYGHAAAGQVSEAAQKGWQTADGLSMLVGQAAESFKIWFDLDPDRQDALDRCRKLVEAVA